MVAMEKEAKLLQEKSVLIKTLTLGYARVEERSYKDKAFLLVVFGIGKAFAAGAMGSLLIAYSHLEGCISVGVSGSIQPSKAPLFTPVIASSFVEHDLDTSAIGDPVGLVSGINIVRFPSDPAIMDRLSLASKKCGYAPIEGPISSGDVFYKDEAPRQKIVERFSSLCVDMETGGLAQMAYVFHVPFAALRVISDADNPSDEYAENASKASDIAGTIALSFLF